MTLFPGESLAATSTTAIDIISVKQTRQNLFNNVITPLPKERVVLPFLNPITILCYSTKEYAVSITAISNLDQIPYTKVHL